MPKQKTDNEWTKQEKKMLANFHSFVDIQKFLNDIPYNDTEECKSPRFVLQKKTAHCAEGAYLAAAILEYMGYPPLIVDFLAENDDDHLIAVFKHNGYWGAVAKSNTTLLRMREPVYKNLRELVMSYFDFYFNIFGVKSLRAYSQPINMKRFDKSNWKTTTADLNWIGDHFTTIKHKNIVPENVKLSIADKDVLDACFLGANQNGLYKAKE